MRVESSAPLFHRRLAQGSTLSGVDQVLNSWSRESERTATFERLTELLTAEIQEIPALDCTSTAWIQDCVDKPRNDNLRGKLLGRIVFQKISLCLGAVIPLLIALRDRFGRSVGPPTCVYCGRIYEVCITFTQLVEDWDQGTLVTECQFESCLSWLSASCIVKGWGWVSTDKIRLRSEVRVREVRQVQAGLHHREIGAQTDGRQRRT